MNSLHRLETPTLWMIFLDYIIFCAAINIAGLDSMPKGHKLYKRIQTRPLLNVHHDQTFSISTLVPLHQIIQVLGLAAPL